MDAKKLNLDYYEHADDYFYIHHTSGTKEAQQLHVHNFFQIYYILKGGITHMMGGLKMPLGRGDAFIIPPGCEHYICITKTKPEFFSFSFLPTLFQDNNFWDSYPGQFLLFLQTADILVIQPRMSIPPEHQLQIEMLITLALEEFTKKSPGSLNAITGILTTVLTFFARVYFEENGNKVNSAFENYRQSMLYCIEYVKNNFTQDISLNMLARGSAMSCSNFCRLFKKITGFTCHQYITKLRIDYACDLLKNSNFDIGYIANTCGYKEFSSFYRSFLKKAGATPSEFRKICKPH